MPTRVEKTRKKKKLSIILIAGGWFLVVVGASLYNSYHRTILSFATAPAHTAEDTDAHRPPLAQSIDIPDVKIHLQIEEADIKNGIWYISEKQATHLTTSARPGEPGNMVIYGHNKQVIFGSLPYVRIGASIVVAAGDGTIHRYRVISKQTVNPNRVDLVSPTDHELLTLYTCTGFLDSQRTVLQATPE